MLITRYFLVALTLAFAAVAHEGHDHGASATDAPTLQSAKEFCIGKTTMNHMGFALPGEGLCNIYLFAPLVLDSPVKYAFAVVGTFVMGMVVELLHWNLRVNIVAKIPKDRSTWRYCAGFLNLTVMFALAYSLMLLTMTYQVCIFLAIVLGLTCGRALWTETNLGKVITCTNTE